MKEITTLNPMNKEAMLQQLDELREKIENDEILGYVYVALNTERGIMFGHDFYPVHRPIMIGALHIKANEMTQCYNINEIAKGLGFD